MPYYHSDPSRDNEPGALPDISVQNRVYEETPGWYYRLRHPECQRCGGGGTYYRHGFHLSDGVISTPVPCGCSRPWESPLVGPFDTEAEALAAAREELRPLAWVERIGNGE